MASRPQVTVVVPVKDRREQMERCLDALLAQDHPSYEVVIMDNDSSDGTAEACRERAARADTPVRVESVNGTVGQSRNRGAQLATGEFVAYVDSDCVPVPGWLSAGLAEFADPDVGLVQGRTLADPSAPRQAWSHTQEITEPNAFYEACNLFVRRDAFLRSAGFDEEIAFFGEDMAGGWAMRSDGWKPAFAPEAVVHHDVTTPPFSWWLKRGLLYGNVALLARRYPEVRREALRLRVVLRPLSAWLLLALVGLVLAPADRRALLLAAPYAWLRRPRDPSLGHLKEATAKEVLFDLSTLAGTLRGSIRHRSLVL